MINSIRMERDDKFRKVEIRLIDKCCLVIEKEDRSDDRKGKVILSGEEILELRDFLKDKEVVIDSEHKPKEMLFRRWKDGKA